MRLPITLGCVLAAALISGCGFYSTIYGNVRGPVTATSQATPATKEGHGCAKSILLGLFAFGDASIDSAKRAAGITSVVSVDFQSTNVLGLYSTFCTVVRGN
jgi:hypothetical protein